MKTTRKLFFVFVVSIYCLACGPSKANLKGLEDQINQERAQIRGLKSAQESAKTYHQFLNSGKGETLLLGQEALQEAIKSYMPYTYQGKELDKKYLSGQISFTKVEGFKLLAGNKAQFWLHFDGSKIKTKKVPAFAKGQVTSLKKAVKAGRMLIETTGYINQSKKTLNLKSTPLSVQFKKENSKSNQSRFLDAARRKIFRKSKKIPLPSSLKGNLSVISTPNHVVIIKK